MKLRALVVDDTALYRRILSEALQQLPDMEVAGTANNGKVALDRATTLVPDLMTLDIEMPEMDGLAVLEALKARGQEIGVIVVSALTRKGGDLTIRALEHGAFDFITKPAGGDPQTNLAALRDALAPIVNAYRRRREIRDILKSRPAVTVPPAISGAAPAPIAPARAAETGRADIVLIGVSTGGPVALAQMLPALPRRLAAPVLVVQHMPPLFTQSLAASLSTKCALAVKEAEDGETALPGAVYLAPGGRHMKAEPGRHGELVLRVSDDPPENNCRPSVDYLFRSVANHFPGRAAAVIMTGMGNDGVLGLRLLKRHGCRVIAQDEASCIVFGMPGEAIKAGVVDVVAPLERLAEEIGRSVRTRPA